MTKPTRNCRNCSAPLTTDDRRFTVSADSEGGPTGDWCSVRCWATTAYGARADAFYAQAFLPVHRGDAETLMPVEGMPAPEISPVAAKSGAGGELEG